MLHVLARSCGKIEAYGAVHHAARIGDGRNKQLDRFILIIPCIRAGTSYTMPLCTARSGNM